MKNLIFIFTIVFCFSCSQSESTQEVKIELNSSETEFSKTEVDSIVDIRVDSKLPFEKKIPELFAKLSLSFDTTKNSKSILPDRFGNAMSRSLTIQNRLELNTVAHLFLYKYADTLSFQNVISNWYGCFGENCVPIKENENLKKS